ncbi:MAG: 8-oxo-dGTP diphosphatase MutT [Myxococcota bacterium]
MDERKLRVVAALIRQGKQVLITERWPGKHMGLTWEFPGGKVEAGESDEQALKRELQEELGIEVDVGSCCFQTTYSYSNKEVHLCIYRCKITEGTPTALDVKSLEWVAGDKLGLRPFPPADMLFVQELVADRIPEESELEDSDLSFKPAMVVRRIKPSASSTYSQG